MFKLTQSSVAFFTTGHVMNLVSNDVRKFDNFFRSFHYLWLAPLELIITTYFVWQMIGWLAIVSSVFMVMFIPILAFIGKREDKYKFYLFLNLQFFAICNCQRAIRAKTRGWQGGSIIEPYEDSIQAIQISSACKRCSVRIIGPIRGALKTASKLQPMRVC